MRSGARSLLVPIAWVAAVVALLLVVFPLGFPNYDTMYALVWGRELAHGMSPDYGAALPPTPHPLADLLGVVTTPLGAGAITVTMAIAYLSLGLIGYLVYRLGSLWFDRWVGGVAAVIVLTSATYLSNGLRAYVDLPYIAILLGALLVETRHRKAGRPVMAMLAVAGLMRPEAWLFSFAYLVYIAVYGDRTRRELVGLAALAASAPLLWAGFDWITAGSPTYSFTGTRESVEALQRKTGPVDLVLYGPRRLGEVLQWPGMVGALGGVLLGFAFLRRRAAIGLAAAALALGAFAILASAGLAILARYTQPAAAVLAIFVALALLGWRLLPAEHPRRRLWQVFAAIVAVMYVVWLPNQWDLDSTVHRDLENQGTIERDLTALVDDGDFKPLCGPIAVPNHRAVPRLAFGLDIRPTQIVSATEQRPPRHGYFVAPASPFVIHHFILDPNDPTRFSLSVPYRFGSPIARNRSWILYRDCR
jgi:hypothetical protein